MEDVKKESEALFPSIANSDSLYEATSSTTEKDDPMHPHLEFEPLIAITCGSEAILVLAVPSPSGDGSFSVSLHGLVKGRFLFRLSEGEKMEVRWR